MISTKMATITIATTMESLALPQDLYWDGSTNIIPLPYSELFSTYECTSGNWLNAHEQTDDFTINSNEGYDLTCSNNNQFNKFSQDSNVACNFFEANLIASAPQLLDNSIYDNKDLNITHNTSIWDRNIERVTVYNQLTPPSSPPQITHSTSLQSIFSFCPSTKVTTTSPAAETTLSNFDDHIFDTSPSVDINSSGELCSSKQINNWQTLPDIITANVEPILSDEDLAREIQIVDDILKSAANELFDSQNTPPSSSIATSLKDGYSSFSEDDDECDGEDGGSANDEWFQHSSINDISDAITRCFDIESQQKRTRSQNSCPEDRKIRKKEQNKNAATRYRQKKKLQMESILVEEQVLMKRNADLKNRYREYKHETKYLRKLIREFYQHKRT